VTRFDETPLASEQWDNRPPRSAMKLLSDIPFSVLDLSPIRAGGTAAESFRNTLDLARHPQ
jgi:hypothetical protein